MNVKVVSNAESVIIEITEQNFEEIVLNANLPVIVELGAEWCPPCRVLAPLYAGIAPEYRGRVLFTSVDTEAHPDVSARLGVQGIPTLIIFEHGQERRRLVGPHPSRLRAILEQEFAQL